MAEKASDSPRPFTAADASDDEEEDDDDDEEEEDDDEDDEDEGANPGMVFQGVGKVVHHRTVPAKTGTAGSVEILDAVSS